MKNSVTWTKFQQNNEKVSDAFEKLSRALFKAEFCPEHTVLHSDPNHPGVEVEPVRIKNGKMASFQAKYFDNRVNYNQIEKSMDKVIQWIAGEIDEVYLFCNAKITRTCGSFKRIEDKLAEKNIQIIIVNDEEILEIVLRYDHIKQAYFDIMCLSFSWFEEQVHRTLDDLGVRFNRNLNVFTETCNKLDLFLKNERAVHYINEKKSSIMKEIQEQSKKRDVDYDYVEKVYALINDLSDVCSDNITDALDWYETVENEIKVESQTKIDLIEAGEVSSDKLDELYWELELVDGLKLNPKEIELLSRNTVLLTGNAGIGKSHLFAMEVNQRIKEEIASIILLGESFSSDRPLAEQFLSLLGLSCSIEEFFSFLERIGEEQKKDVIIFIDAINESSDKSIWKTGLKPFIDMVSHYKNISLAFSYRSGYEKMLLSESINYSIKSGQVCRVLHTGFTDNSVRAMRQFFDYYGIPFSPVYVLQERMTNPLFLMIFCKSYSENYGSLSLTNVFNKYINVVEEEIRQRFGIESDSGFLWDLLIEIASDCIENGDRRISKRIIYKLQYWNDYGFNDKLKFIHIVTKAGLLIEIPNEDSEEYSFGYDLFRDYVLAKYIVGKYSDISQLKSYIIEDVLKIENGAIGDYGGEDIFFCIFDLITTWECNELMGIFDLIVDDNDSWHLCNNYVLSYSWKNDAVIKADVFVDFINNHSISIDTLMRTLIENSMRTNSEINASFLHKILFNMKIADRDYQWTIFINGLYEREERIYQLIDLFEHNLQACEINDKECEQFLILFGWLFTASNRSLRDHASKAMVNLLGKHPWKIQWVIEQFIYVDDPYIVERILCNCLGAIIGWNPNKKIISSVVNFLYKDFFLEENVFEDALVREYARLIIEYYIKKYSNDLKLDVSVFRPPYTSSDIPTVKKQEYILDEYGSGYHRIASSMYPNDMPKGHMYGYFGRYVFELVIHMFDNVNVENCYYYAMQYICDVIGYTDERFSEYDSRLYRTRYYYPDMARIERIGKKYQWIALRNIVARLGDNHILKDEVPYDGTWQLDDIRDFDPTIRNVKDSEPIKFPVFSDANIIKNDFSSSDDYDIVGDWLANEGDYIDSNANSLIIEDTEGIKWVRLYINSEQNKKIFSLRNRFFETQKGEQLSWFQAEAYFVKKEDIDKLYALSLETNFWGQWFPEENCSTMRMFGEYPWSPACNEIRDHEWQSAYGESQVKNAFDISKIPVMNSIISALWESEYDASFEERPKQDIPCLKLMEDMNLHEEIINGNYYSDKGELVAFDSKNIGVPEGLMFRLDKLQFFLKKRNLQLFWILLAEKRYYCGGRNENQRWSEWSGAAVLKESGVEQKMHCTNLEKIRG